MRQPQNILAEGYTRELNYIGQPNYFCTAPYGNISMLTTIPIPNINGLYFY